MEENGTVLHPVVTTAQNTSVFWYGSHLDPLPSLTTDPGGGKRQRSGVVPPALLSRSDAYVDDRLFFCPDEVNSLPWRFETLLESV